MQFMFLGGGPATAEYQETKAFTGSSRTPTITGIAIGAVRSDRRVFELINMATAGADCALTSATIGGISATIHVQVSQVISGGYLRSVLISAQVPTGTTANVALTFAAGASDYSGNVSSVRVIDLVSDTPLTTPVTFAGVADPASVNVDVQANGVMFAVISTRYDTTIATSGFTEDYNIGVSSIAAFAGGHLNVAATQTGRPVTVTNDSPGTMQVAMLAAAFR